MENLLETARKEINETDRLMAELFVRRMEAVRNVAAYKKENGLPIYDEAREQAVLDRNVKYIEAPELRDFYLEFMQNTMNVSKKYQKLILEEN